MKPKNSTMKIFEVLIWVFGILAGIMIVLAGISFISGTKIFGVVHVINLFHVANTFLLFAIFCTLYMKYLNKKIKKEG
jgi:hypothetical protein